MSIENDSKDLEGESRRKSDTTNIDSPDKMSIGKSHQTLQVIVLIYLLCFGYIVSIISPQLHQMHIFHGLALVTGKSLLSKKPEKQIDKQIDFHNKNNPTDVSDYIGTSEDCIETATKSTKVFKNQLLNQLTYFKSTIDVILKKISTILLRPISKILQTIFKLDVHAFQLDKKILDHSFDFSATDLSRFQLNAKQLDMIYESLNSSLFQDKIINQLAKLTDIIISPYLMYQYHEAIDWIGTYHGLKIEEAVKNTILWRKEFNINSIDIRKYTSLLQKGFIRVSQLTDKYSRAIVYIKLDRFIKGLDPDTYIKVVMNAVERADRTSPANKFITLIDMKHFSFNNCPSISFFKQLIQILKYNYPNRLSAIYLLNTGPAFTLFWNLIKPLLPKKALKKFIVLRGANRIAQELDKSVGLQYIEKSYGGDENIDLTKEEELKRYIESGYWEKRQLKI